MIIHFIDFDLKHCLLRLIIQLIMTVKFAWQIATCLHEAAVKELLPLILNYYFLEETSIHSLVKLDLQCCTLIIEIVNDFALLFNDKILTLFKKIEGGIFEGDLCGEILGKI